MFQEHIQELHHVSAKRSFSTECGPTRVFANWIVTTTKNCDCCVHMPQKDPTNEANWRVFGFVYGFVRGLKRHLLVFCFASQLTRGYRYRYALAPSWCLPVKTVLNIDRKGRAALNQIWTHTWTKISSSGPNVAYAASVPVPINTTGPWFEFAAAVMAVPITFPLSVSAS